jgi:hypothetical protein
MMDLGSNPQEGTYVKSEFLLLAVSHYIGDPDVILITGFRCPSVGASLGSTPTMCKASGFVALEWVLH